MKLSLICLIIFIPAAVLSQGITFKFTVKKSLNRVNQNGQWGEWRELGDINSKMYQYLLINLEGRKVDWVTQYDKEPVKTNHYTIKDISTDTAYADFGISVLTIEATTANKNEQRFRLLFGRNTERSYYILITGKEFVQSKLYGNVEELTNQ